LDEYLETMKRRPTKAPPKKRSHRNE
jgi:hypothetical protein